MTNRTRTLSIFSIFVLSIYAFLSFSAGWFTSVMGQSGSIVFLGFYCCAIVPLAWLSAGWLAWAGREKISNTLVWSMFQVIFLVSIMLYTSPVVGSFFASMLLLLFPLLAVVDILYAYQNGISVRFIAIGSIGIMWSILLAWRITGNLINTWIETLASSSNNLWWLNALLYGFGCAVIAGIVAFAAESLSVLSKELAAK